MTDNTVLVTGAFGFIGSQLTQHLLRLGFDVVAADQPLSQQSPIGLRRYERYRLEFPRVELFDIRSPSSCDEALGRIKPRFIIHLAALPGIRTSFDAPVAYWETNLNGSLNVIQAARQGNVQAIFLASSSSVYGPIHEGLASAETDRIDQPASPYAASKAAMELMASSLASSIPFPVVSLRFFTVFGPFGRPDMAAWKFTKALLAGEKIVVNGDGNHLRDFTPIDELLRKLEKLITLAEIPGGLDGIQSLNLGSGTPTSVNDLIEAIAGRLDKSPKVSFGGSARGDVRETRSGTDLQEKLGLLGGPISLSDGLDTWVNWSLANRDLILSF